MNDDRLRMKDLFNKHKENDTYSFLFVEPGGNCGDYLIYKGAEKLANICGIKYKSVTSHEFLDNSYPHESVVYIHGSGGFVPWWSGTPILALKKLSLIIPALLLSDHQHFISITII